MTFSFRHLPVTGEHDNTANWEQLQEAFNNGSVLSSGASATLGTGELVGARVTEPPAAHVTNFLDGSLGTPAKIGVSSAFSRVDSTTRAELNVMGPVGTDGPDGATVARFAVKGTAASQVQECAVVASSWQFGESNGGEGSPDATPFYGLARVSSKAVGRAIPMYLESVRETATANGQQVAEFRCKNESGVGDSYVAGAPSKSMGLWLNASGASLSACGFQIGHGFAQQFDVGFAVNETAVKSAAFRDDSEAERGLYITKPHAKASIAVAASAGAVVVGGAEATEAAIFQVIGTGPSALITANENKLGFFAHAPVVKPTVNKGSTVDEVNTALKNLGLIGGT